MNLFSRAKSKSAPKITAKTEKEKIEQKGAFNSWKELSKAAIYLLVFLLPIFFLPFTSNVLDFQKQALLLFLVLISLFSWLLGSLTEGKISLNLNIFHLPVIVFLAVLGLSTCFSAYRYASFWGWPLKIGSSFLTYLGLILLYFLITNLFQKKEVFWLFITLIISSFFALVFGGLQIFGKFYLPLDFTKDVSFNTIGSVPALGIFIGSFLPLTLFLVHITKRLIKLLLFFFLIAALGLVFIVNSFVVWVSILVGMAAIMIFGIAKRGTFEPFLLNLVMAIFVVSLFFIFLRTPIPFLHSLPSEVSLSSKAGLDIVNKTLKDFNPPTSLFLGSGPGTFTYDYSRFKPETINQTVFWADRFSSSGSEILDMLAATGILGLISFLGILGTLGFLEIKQLIGKTFPVQIQQKPTKKDFQWLLVLGIFSSLLSLTAAIFLYPSNFSLLFLFWLFISGLVALQEGKIKTWVLEPSSLASIGVSFVFVSTLVFGVGLLFMSGQRYAAEMKYLQGITAFQKGDTQLATNRLLSAINLTNRNQDNYWRDLSQIYLFNINQELQKPGASKDELSQTLTPLMANLVNAAKMATDVGPKNVANWSIRGFVYSQMRDAIPGADEWTLKCYEEAKKLEPTNPFIFTEIGKVYLAQNKASEAKENFQKAIDLKSDYSPALFQTAMVSQLEGKTPEAIEKLEALKQLSPFDVGLSFQLGMLYYADKKFDKAKIELERTVSLSETHSNARYFLGLIYDRNGEKEKAIEQFEVVSSLNPQIEEIKKILANLKAGKPALQGVIPSQPPVEEKPPEQIKK